MIITSTQSIKNKNKQTKTKDYHIVPLDDPSDTSSNPRISTGLRQAQEILGKYNETIKLTLEPKPIHNSIGEQGHKGKTNACL